MESVKQISPGSPAWQAYQAKRLILGRISRIATALYEQSDRLHFDKAWQGSLRVMREEIDKLMLDSPSQDQRIRRLERAIEDLATHFGSLEELRSDTQEVAREVHMKAWSGR